MQVQNAYSYFIFKISKTHTEKNETNNNINNKISVNQKCMKNRELLIIYGLLYQYLCVYVWRGGLKVYEVVVM